MKNYLLRVIALFIVVAVTVPNLALAESYIQYQPRTTQELIAYLYGRIVQLQEIQKLIEGGSSSQSSTQSLFDYVSVDTHKATEVTDTTAYLSAEVELHGKATAYAWFEYGQDEDFLDQKTGKVSVRSAYDRAIRKQVRSLEEDERYYFRIVAEDNKKAVKYGEIFAFRTDESDN